MQSSPHIHLWQDRQLATPSEAHEHMPEKVSGQPRQHHPQGTHCVPQALFALRSKRQMSHCLESGLLLSPARRLTCPVKSPSNPSFTSCILVSHSGRCQVPEPSPALLLPGTSGNSSPSRLPLWTLLVSATSSQFHLSVKTQPLQSAQRGHISLLLHHKQLTIFPPTCTEPGPTSSSGSSIHCPCHSPLT